SQMPLQCPFCPNCYITIDPLYRHLVRTHKKTPKQAGIAMHCECGVEVQSCSHEKKIALAEAAAAAAAAALAAETI
ncbi:hypothetical protein PFISCL1PPCAC_25996, partial [Pristionchus fissidentatus]